MTWFMVFGFLFFFTTRLWNEDDRPRMNSYRNGVISNLDGNLSITRAVYIESYHELNLLVQEVTFWGANRLNIAIVVHNLDGSYYVPTTRVIKESANMNQTRSLVTVELEPEILGWYFVEVVLLENGEVGSRLTIDWRLVERSYERLSPNDITNFFFTPAEVNNNYSDKFNNEQNYQYYYGHAHHHGEDGIDVELQLSIALSHYERLNDLLAEQPHNPILIESVAYYSERILHYQNLFQTMVTDNEGEYYGDDGY